MRCRYRCRWGGERERGKRVLNMLFSIAIVIVIVVLFWCTDGMRQFKAVMGKEMPAEQIIVKMR